MKKQFILLAVAALTLAACSKTNEQPEPEGIQMIFRAYQEGSQGTKTTVQEGGTQVYWEPSDEIKVFFKGSGSRFISQNTAEATVADFSGTLNILIGANEGASSTTKIFGLYPYRADAVSDGSSVTTTLPAEQTGRAGSFAKNTHISLAATNANSVDLGFYNVTGGLRFSLTQEGIKSVTFEGNNGENLAGKIKLAFEGGIPAIKEVSEGEKVITLNAPGGGTFQTGQWYYIEVIPGTLSKGFKMVFSKGNESAKLSSSSSVTIGRGKYGSLADADEGLIFKENGGGPSGNNIVFADDKVKSKLVAKFDTSGDGEISYEEAAAVTSLEGVFGAIKTYSSFDEFQYFTGVTEVSPSMFEGWILSSIVLPQSIICIGERAFGDCTKLTSIVIPDSVTTIMNEAFINCSSLTSVEIPDSVINIFAGAFMSCTSLTFIIIPDGVLDISGDTFRNCTSLASVDLPDRVEFIYDSAFRNCTSLTSIELPDTVTTIDEFVFENCSSLTSIIIPGGVTSIKKSTFQNCSNLASVILSEGVISIDESAFDHCTSLASVVIPSSVTTIGEWAFESCTSLTSVVIPENVTTIGGGAFEGCSGLTSVVIPDSVTNIAGNSFEFCTSLTSVVIPESVSTIGSLAFSHCTSLTSVVIPESVITIGSLAFYHCTSMTSVVIPESVSTIGGGAFSNCTNMTFIESKASNPPTLGEYAQVAVFGDVFDNTNNCPIYVPASSVEAYKTAWIKYADRIQAVP